MIILSYKLKFFFVGSFFLIGLLGGFFINKLFLVFLVLWVIFVKDFLFLIVFSFREIGVKFKGFKF